MTYTLSSPGWFDKVNGFKVVRLPLPASLMSHAGDFYGHHGIEIHRQQGPNGDITSTQLARGYPIATWNVDDDGVIRQYNDCSICVWHGDSVSHYAFGIEHTGFTGTPFTDKQLVSSAALCAAIVEYTEDRWGDVIPLTKVPRVSVAGYTAVRGFWDHDNVDDGELNEGHHTDHLEGRSWPNFLKDVGHFLNLVPRPTPPFHGTLLKAGTDAVDVLAWKRRMHVKGLFRRTDLNDGPHYGPAIEKATKAFQAKKKLDIDGIVGSKTWGAAWS